MPIDRDTLDTVLKHLQAEHRRSQYKDAAERERTEELIAEIERQLRYPDPQRTQDQLRRRLQEAVGEFEVRHPQLTAALGQVIDLLSGMGI